MVILLQSVGKFDHLMKRENSTGNMASSETPSTLPPLTHLYCGFSSVHGGQICGF